MRITYSPEGEVAYIHVASGKHHKTQELDERVNVDFGTEGQVLGVEVLYVGRPRVDDIKTDG